MHRQGPYAYVNDDHILFKLDFFFDNTRVCAMLFSLQCSLINYLFFNPNLFSSSTKYMWKTFWPTLCPDILFFYPYLFFNHTLKNVQCPFGQYINENHPLFQPCSVFQQPKMKDQGPFAYHLIKHNK